MKHKPMSIWLALLAILALIAASCGAEERSDFVLADLAATTETTIAPDRTADTVPAAEAEQEAGPEAEPADEPEPEVEEAVPKLPGEGVTVRAGRANWTSGYFQASLYKQLLEELGYSVTDPAENELDPEAAYVSMAEGGIDFWPNSWYPLHDSWLASRLPDGSLVGDHVSVVGEEMISGGLQGFVITKSFAEEHRVFTLDALNDNPEALAAFDAADPVPGNGLADIFGCPQTWTCDNVINNQIAFGGWDNIQQVVPDDTEDPAADAMFTSYDEMFAQARETANNRLPMVAYIWTPTSYVTELLPGIIVYWIGMDQILDDSNPAEQEGGDQHSQRGADGSGGYAVISPEQCPSAEDTDNGRCPIGWEASDILVTARNGFLEENPAAAKMLELVRLSVIDVSLANVEQDEGAEPDDLAARWIAENRGLVDEWVAAALAAA